MASAYTPLPFVRSEFKKKAKCAEVLKVCPRNCFVVSTTRKYGHAMTEKTYYCQARDGYGVLIGCYIDAHCAESAIQLVEERLLESDKGGFVLCAQEMLEKTKQ